MTGPARVVILGAGLAAFEAAFLIHMRLHERVEVRVVCDSDDFLLRPNLVYAPFGADPDASRLELGTVLVRHHIGFVPARVQGVDLDAGRVHVTRGRPLPYEHLVIATGATTRAAEVPGLAQHAVSLGDVADALALRQRFEHLRGEARAGARQRVLFAVPRHNRCSEPLYELALMLDTWLRRGDARAHVEIAFATYEASFAEACGPRMDTILASEFADRDIEARASEVLIEVLAHEASFAGGGREPFDLLVTIPPHVASVPYAGLPADERGFLRVEGSTRQVVGHPEAYAPGDAGDFPVKHAFLALLQADAAAEHLAALIRGRDFHHPFEPVCLSILDMLDRAAFAQLPLELTGDPDHPVRLRSGADGEYRVGVGRPWRTAKRVLASFLMARLAAGEPSHAGVEWRLLDVGMRAMAGMLADAEVEREYA